MEISREDDGSCGRQSISFTVIAKDQWSEARVELSLSESLHRITIQAEATYTVRPDGPEGPFWSARTYEIIISPECNSQEIYISEYQ